MPRWIKAIGKLIVIVVLLCIAIGFAWDIAARLRHLHHPASLQAEEMPGTSTVISIFTVTAEKTGNPVPQEQDFGQLYFVTIESNGDGGASGTFQALRPLKTGTRVRIFSLQTKDTLDGIIPIAVPAK